jgi:hypothetical protein
MFKSLMAQIFTFSEIPEELWSQATELAERLLRHQKESGPRPNSTRSSRFTTSFPCCATRPRWRWIRRPGCPGTTPQPPRSQCSLLPPAPSDLAAPVAKARASGKLVRFGTVMRQGCEPRCQIDAVWPGLIYSVWRCWNLSPSNPSKNRTCAIILAPVSGQVLAKFLFSPFLGDQPWLTRSADRLHPCC